MIIFCTCSILSYSITLFSYIQPLFSCFLWLLDRLYPFSIIMPLSLLVGMN